MITLRTGLPRSGKSHSLTAWLADLMKHWDTEAGSRDRRRVYSNVNGLKLPHDPLPITDEVFNADGKLVSFSVVWSLVENGSLVIIDEAQDAFGSRPVGVKTPPHVQYMNTHGHQGLDVVLITQHPKLLDMAIRRLIGKHFHIRKNSLKPPFLPFIPDAITYEWDHCEDGLQGLRHAVMGTYSYSKKINALYVSATEHRTPQFKRPWWIWVPIVLLPVGIYAGYLGVGALKSSFSGKPLAEQIKPPVAPPKSVLQDYALTNPRPAASAPLANVAVEPTETPAAAPKVELVLTGCARLRNVCRCYDQHAQVLEKPVAYCQAQTTKVLFANARPVDMSKVEDLAPPPPPRADLEMIEWASKNRTYATR